MLPSVAAIMGQRKHRGNHIACRLCAATCIQPSPASQSINLSKPEIQLGLKEIECQQASMGISYILAIVFPPFSTGQLFAAS